MNEVTITLSNDDAYWMKQFCGDAAIYWDTLLSQVTSGRRPDLDESSCRRLRDRAQGFYNMIDKIDSK